MDAHGWLSLNKCKLVSLLNVITLPLNLKKINKQPIMCVSFFFLPFLSLILSENGHRIRRAYRLKTVTHVIFFVQSKHTKINHCVNSKYLNIWQIIYLFQVDLHTQTSAPEKSPGNLKKDTECPNQNTLMTNCKYL